MVGELALITQLHVLSSKSLADADNNTKSIMEAPTVKPLVPVCLFKSIFTTKIFM